MVLTLTDMAAASILTLMIVVSVLVQSLLPGEGLITNEICYRQKVASQILEASMINGCLSKLARLYEAGHGLDSVLNEMSQLCPQNLVCCLKIYVSENNGLIACTGSIHDTLYGESSVLITTLRGKMDLICQVSRR